MFDSLILVICSVHFAYTLQLFMQPDMLLHFYFRALDWLYNRGGVLRFVSKPLGLCPLCQMPYMVVLFAWLFGISNLTVILIALFTVIPYYQLLVRWTN